MNHLYWLDQIQSTHRSQVGDKAFYLSLLAQKGYPLVPGLVVASPVFQEFLETINWLEPLLSDLPNSSLHLDVDNPLQLQAIAQTIRQSVYATSLAETWTTSLLEAVQSWHAEALILRPSFTVRSSTDTTLSTRAAGLMAAHFCRAEVNSLNQGLKRVWSELFRAKSLLYWQRLGIQLQDINLAVLVQPIWSAIASGDLQTTPSHAEIRAVWGLGSALKQGEVPPDVYHVHLKAGTIQHQQIGYKTHAYRIASPSNPQMPAEREGDLTVGLTACGDCLQAYAITSEQQQQPVLTEPQLQQLTQLTQTISADLGDFLRVEWILTQAPNTDAQFYLTQAGLHSPHSLLPLHAEDPIPSTESVPLQTAALTTSPRESWRFSNMSPVVVSGMGAAMGQTFGRAYVVTNIKDQLSDIPEDAVLVASVIMPDWFVGLKQALGIITEKGGMTSHGAVIARELGIPAVVGASGATQLIKTGETIFVDGDRGDVYRVDNATTSTPASPTPTRPQSLLDHIGSQLNLSSRPAGSPPTNATPLLVNLSQVSTLKQLEGLPIDGIGLLRAEHMMIEFLEHKHPSWWLQQGRQSELIDQFADRIRQFAQAVTPYPVFYRSLDLRSHEFLKMDGAPDQTESNPILGQHGTLSYQDDPTLFESELIALRRVQQLGFENVHLLLPFVRTVEEFQFCHRRIIQAGLNQVPRFQVWIMAEVPSVLFLLPEYKDAGVQGISIGSNDLTQLLLGLDRDHPGLMSAFDQHHPAVMRAIQQLIQTARQLNLPCSICGQAPVQHPEIIESLVKWGISSISVSPDAVRSTYDAIARAEKRIVLEAIRQGNGNRE